MKNRVKHSLRAVILLAGTALSLVMVIPAVSAQDTQSRLQRLENEMQTLSRAVFKGEQPPEGYSVMSGNLGADAAVQANIEVRLSQLENEMRSMTGRLEEISFQNRQIQSRLESELAEMKELIAETSAAPRGGSILAPVQNGQTVQNPGQPDFGYNDIPAQSSQNQLGVLHDTVDQNGNVIETDRDNHGTWPNEPAGLYERSFGYLQERNYDRAEEGFSLFLKQYPQHDLAANAKYWLGETFYVRQHYDRAAREFAESYQNYPNGPKGPDNLLKLGMSLAGLNKKNDACLSLGQLKTQYPDAPSSIIIRAEAEEERLGCRN